MDFEMISYKDEVTKDNIWDFKVKNNTFQTIDYKESVQQRSLIATYLQRGTIPQLADVGNQWIEFMTGTIAPNELNTQIRKSIIELTGELSYLPRYKEENGKLVVEVKEL